jgi:predicted lipoprotein with Yx(FWY)xxD motif
MLALFILTLAAAPRIDAQSQPAPCTPPPGTANLIVCFGNTPCPAGYIDPVGLHARNTSQNAANLNSTRWLCMQDTSAQNGTDSTGQSTAPTNSTGAALPAGNTSFVSIAAPAVPAITTTLGLNSASALGPFLTDNQGMTLYIRGTDSNGMSTCNNACAVIWLPLTPPAGDATLPSGASGTLATLLRSDGTQQLSYNGMPLYRYTGDFKPGDTNGQGLDASTTDGTPGVWKLATP